MELEKQYRECERKIRRGRERQRLFGPWEKEEDILSEKRMEREREKNWQREKCIQRLFKKRERLVIKRKEN